MQRKDATTEQARLSFLYALNDDLHYHTEAQKMHAGLPHQYKYGQHIEVQKMLKQATQAFWKAQENNDDLATGFSIVVIDPSQR